MLRQNIFYADDSVLHIQHYLEVVYVTVSQGVERVKWVWRAYTSYPGGQVRMTEKTLSLPCVLA